MKNKSIQIESPIYVFLKMHKCPICDNKIIPKKIKRTINSKSIEAKNYDFSCGDSFLAGDTEFTLYIFYCEYCSKEYEIKEIMQHEKMLKEAEIRNGTHNKIFMNIKLFINKYFRVYF
ncbi:MAG: hypothetical protein FWC01_06130 [Treponema sp.]|nr:hypothetical protein [Treponema sp.]MCL2237632.1 hypothetical protein [Treponema sp.]